MYVSLLDHLQWLDHVLSNEVDYSGAIADLVLPRLVARPQMASPPLDLDSLSGEFGRLCLVQAVEQGPPWRLTSELDRSKIPLHAQTLELAFVYLALQDIPDDSPTAEIHRVLLLWALLDGICLPRPWRPSGVEWIGINTTVQVDNREIAIFTQESEGDEEDDDGIALVEFREITNTNGEDASGAEDQTDAS